MSFVCKHCLLIFEDFKTGKTHLKNCTPIHLKLKEEIIKKIYVFNHYPSLVTNGVKFFITSNLPIDELSFVEKSRPLLLSKIHPLLKCFKCVRISAVFVLKQDQNSVSVTSNKYIVSRKILLKSVNNCLREILGKVTNFNWKNVSVETLEITLIKTLNFVDHSFWKK